MKMTLLISDQQAHVHLVTFLELREVVLSWVTFSRPVKDWQH